MIVYWIHLLLKILILPNVWEVSGRLFYKCIYLLKGVYLRDYHSLWKNATIVWCTNFAYLQCRVIRQLMASQGMSQHLFLKTVMQMHLKVRWINFLCFLCCMSMLSYNKQLNSLLTLNCFGVIWSFDTQLHSENSYWQIIEYV